MTSTKRIYLDHNATTPLHEEVKSEISQKLDVFGNPSSLHSFGRETKKHIESSRETIANFIGAKPDEVIFLGSGSEANNTVLNIFACNNPHCNHDLGGKAIITTKMEHPCILEAAKCMKDRGQNVIFLGNDSKGRVNIDEYESILANEQIALVSIMMANNEIGTIQNIKELCKKAHQYGAFFHTDAVQALGKIPLNVKDLGIDLLSLSAHKVYGPKGVGALYINKGAPFCPMIRGGHQERGRRAGTENFLGIVGFGKAVEMLSKEMDNSLIKIKELQLKLEKGILEKIPDVTINGDRENRTPNTLNVSFKGAEGEAILLYLDLEGISVSTGSACSSGSLEPSHVLLSLGLDPEKAHGSIRFSIGKDNTHEDIDIVLNKLPQIIEKIRNMSTAY